MASPDGAPSETVTAAEASPAGPASRREEMEGKAEAVRRAARDRGFERILLSARRNFAWLTAGGDNHVVDATEDGAAAVLIEPGGIRVRASVIDARRIADEELHGLEIDVEELPWEADLADGLPIDRGPLGRDDALESSLVVLRQVLNRREQDAMLEIGAEAARVVREAIAAACSGDTERAVASRLRAALTSAGMAAPVVLVAADERIARYRHPLPTDAVITASLMVVAVAEREGLHVALTRMASLAGAASADLDRRYKASWSVFDALRAGSTPGRPLHEVLTDGLRAYNDAGYGDEWRLHHQGGTIGYRAREIIATRDTRHVIVAAGIALAWNPSITGAKAEETILVTPAGPVLVTADDGWPRDGRDHPAMWPLGQGPARADGA